MAGKDADITYEKMLEAAKHLITEKGNLERKLKKLDSYCDHLVSDGYTTSKGSGAFDEAFKEFTRGVTDTLQGLEGMAEFLKKASKAYEDLDNELAKGVKG
ncbi:hypothetical protein OK074_8374 [Actinobacteria bacterium OK074]|nr:hypothetical protein OK074_8374 [Actinobacteria bacterium OK074]